MAKHRIRRWLQFGVLDLLVLTTIVAVVAVLRRPSRIETYYEPLAEGTAPGQHWSRNGLRMKFRWCPPGVFQMGEPPNQVSVTLTRGFWLGKYEVTQGEYRQVMNDNPSHFPEEGRDAALAAGVDVDKLPVESMSWDNAVEFCRVLTEQERKVGRLPPGWEYRLPTEVQWKYACRAGTQTRYSFGNDESRLVDFAWCDTNAARRTHEVGQKLPNPWGLHDVHGNVWEWCQDCCPVEVDGEAESGGDPEAADCGGGWLNTGGKCQSAAAIRGERSRQSSALGFRMALIQSH